MTKGLQVLKAVSEAIGSMAAHRMISLQRAYYAEAMPNGLVFVEKRGSGLRALLHMDGTQRSGDLDIDRSLGLALVAMAVSR